MLVRTVRVAAWAVPAVVVVVGGDTVVGNALQLLLRGSGYDARFEVAPSLDTKRAFRGAGLILLAPGLDEWGRRAVLSSVDASRDHGALPILELVSVTARRPGEDHALLPWPCRTEDLEREIDAVLRGGGSARREGPDPEGKRIAQ